MSEAMMTGLAPAPVAVRPRSGAQHAHGERRLEYVGYAALAYPAFFVGAVLGRMSPPAPGVKRRPSVFAETREMVETTIPWAFTGR